MNNIWNICQTYKHICKICFPIKGYGERLGSMCGVFVIISPLWISPHDTRKSCDLMMTSSNEKHFHVTGILRGKFTDHRWIPPTKANDAKLWCFLWSAPWINTRDAGDLRRHRAHYDVIVMCKYKIYDYCTVTEASIQLRVKHTPKIYHTRQVSK